MKRRISAIEGNGDGVRTVAEATYLRLREDLTGLRFRPGTRLRFKTLSERYGAGVSPLREALSRLVSERLVVALGQRGFRVPEVSSAEMHDILDLRRMLEGEALRRSIALGDAAWEREVHAAFQRMVRHGPDSQPHSLAWDRLHQQFHRALVAACGSPWLLHITEMLFRQSIRYRRLHTSSREGRSVGRDVHREHRALMSAALERRPGEACRLFEQHVLRTAAVVVRVIPDLPAPA